MQGRPLNELKWALKWKCEMCKRFEILFAGRFLSEFFTSSIGFSIVFRPSSITMTNEHLGHLASVFCCYWKSNELYNTVAIYFYLYRNAPVSLRFFFFWFFFILIPIVVIAPGFGLGLMELFISSFYFACAWLKIISILLLLLPVEVSTAAKAKSQIRIRPHPDTNALWSWPLKGLPLISRGRSKLISLDAAFLRSFNPSRASK